MAMTRRGSARRLELARRALLAGFGGAVGFGASAAAAGATLPQVGAEPPAAENIVSVLDSVPPAERAAIRRGKPAGDVSRYVRKAIGRLTNNSILLFPPGVYLMDELIEDPLLKVPYASAYFEELTNVAVFGHGATIQRTEKVRNTGAVLVFRRCRKVGLYGLHYEAPHSRGGRDSGSLSAFLGCSGVDVHASIDGGRAIAQFSSTDLGMDPSGATSDTRVVGSARNSHYGVIYYHPLGESHHVDLRSLKVVRSLTVTGVRRLSGRITSEGGTSDLLFIGRHGDPIKDVNLDYSTRKPTNHAILFSVRDENPVSFERMRFAGAAHDTMQSAISIETVSRATLMQDLDFSSLQISGSRKHGLVIAPAEPATIRNVSVGDASAAQSAVFIDNSAEAAIAGLRVMGKRLRSGSGAPALLSKGGEVRDVVILGCELGSDEGETALSVGNGRRIRIDHCICEGAIDLRGSEAVSPLAQNIIGPRPGCVADELHDEMSTLFVQTVLARSGSSRVAGLRDGLPGQRLAIVANGGTPLLIAGRRLRIEGDFAMRDGDFIELLCTETNEGGDSVFLELARRRARAL
jgi:hypothetical protein